MGVEPYLGNLNFPFTDRVRLLIRLVHVAVFEKAVVVNVVGDICREGGELPALMASSISTTAGSGS